MRPEGDRSSGSEGDAPAVPGAGAHAAAPAVPERNGRRREALLAWSYRAFPDPHGLASFGLVASVLLGYVGLRPAEGHLFSEHVPLEVLGHVWLLLGAPAGLLLAARSFLEDSPSPFALLTVPLGALLTMLGFLGALLGLVHAVSAA